MNYLLEGKETERLLLRKVEENDFRAWLEFFKDPRSDQHWIGKKGTPEEECTRWYARQFERYRNDEGGMNVLIEKSTGKLIGHAGLLIQSVDGHTELEVAYSLLPAFWNKGFATEAARKCRDHAFQNRLADSLISIIAVTNTPSEKVALKNGMWLDRKILYKENRVNIFRVTWSDWESLAGVIA